MNGIFPDYVGPTVEARHGALFPDWIGTGEFEVVVEVPGGGGSKKIKDSRATDPMLARLLREDEEILAVVMVAMRVIH